MINIIRYISIILIIILFTAVPVSARQISTTLNGGNEVEFVNTNTTGNFMMDFNDDDSIAIFKLDVFSGNDITSAHLHCGDEGEDGPIVAYLYGGENPEPKNVNGTLASSSLNVANIQPAASGECDSEIILMSDLAQAIHDGNIYVNVHSTSYPSGLIRGQLGSDILIGTSTDMMNISMGRSTSTLPTSGNIGLPNTGSTNVETLSEVDRQSLMESIRVLNLIIVALTEYMNTR